MAKASPKLKLATTSSVQDSGLLKVLCGAFTRQGGAQVEVRAVGTGAALRLGRRGEVDAVLVHNLPSELQFMEGGHGVNRREFMINDFVLLGPPEDPAGAAGDASVFDALACIFREGALFFSRGDDSGTNLRELELWGASAELPFGRPWYRRAEGGMISCLEAASGEGAYTLSDMGTYLAQVRRLSLKVICADPEHLRNAYSVICVNPAQHPHVQQGAADDFARFLTGAQGQGLIEKFRKGAQPLFYPLWPGRPEQPRSGKRTGIIPTQNTGGSHGRNC